MRLQDYGWHVEIIPSFQPYGKHAYIKTTELTKDLLIAKEAINYEIYHHGIRQDFKVWDDDRYEAKMPKIITVWQEYMKKSKELFWTLKISQRQVLRKFKKNTMPKKKNLNDKLSHS